MRKIKLISKNCFWNEFLYSEIFFPKHIVCRVLWKIYSERHNIHFWKFILKILSLEFFFRIYFMYIGNSVLKIWFLKFCFRNLILKILFCKSYSRNWRKLISKSFWNIYFKSIFSENEMVTLKIWRVRERNWCGAWRIWWGAGSKTLRLIILSNYCEISILTKPTNLIKRTNHQDFFKNIVCYCAHGQTTGSKTNYYLWIIYIPRLLKDHIIENPIESKKRWKCQQEPVRIKEENYKDPWNMLYIF